MKKKIILFSLLLICSIGMCLAQSENDKVFEKKEAALTQKLQQSFEENNYQEVERDCKALLALFNEQDKETQQKYNWLLANYYYNLACAQSILKKKSEALESFESAYQNGYTNYHHILEDTDLDNIRKEKAFALAEACKDGSRGLNCRGLATVLNECYLAMGFKSRFITCMPKKYISDCHVINAVYSTTLGKWLWMDPTQNAWVMDENGTLLSIQEVRERLRDGRPLRLNEEANWNNQEKTLKEGYLDNYMAKNLYYMNCTLRSEFGTEDKKYNPADYAALLPEGYYNEMEKGSHIVNDDAWFWQAPY